MKNTRENILLASQELLVKHGYAGFSFGALAEHLQISKGVLTYHFSQKSLLLNELVKAYFDDAAAYMAKHMVLDKTAPEALESYISSNLRYVSDHLVRTLAMIQIIGNHRNKEGELIFSDQDHLVYQPLIEIFRYGQSEEKSFRSFSPELMAMFVRSTIDALSGRIANSEIKDIEGAIHEAVLTFTLATRSDELEKNTQ